MPVVLRIHLDYKDKIFSPGAEVTGHVEARDRFKSSFNISGLTCGVEGVVDTFQHFMYDNYFESVKFLDESIDLAKGGATIQKSNNTFPFKFTLPNQLPPSVYVTSRNWIRYRIVAKVPDSKSSATYRNIYIVCQIPKENLRYQRIRSSIEVPKTDDDVIVPYGDGALPENEPFLVGNRQMLTRDKKVDEAYLGEQMAGMKLDEEKEGGGRHFEHDEKFNDEKFTEVASVRSVGTNMTDATTGYVPQKISSRFDHSEKYPFGISMDVDFCHPGIYTDEEVDIGVRIIIDGPLPAMTLHSLKITIVEYTKLKAQIMSNTHVRPYVLMHLREPYDLTTASVHDFSEQIRRTARFPEMLAPDFNLDTMSRHYIISVHAQVSKSNISHDITAQRPHRLHMNARQGMEIYGRASQEMLLPTYSKQY